MTVDARSAVPLSVSTPRPASVQETDMQFARIDALGAGGLEGVGASGGDFTFYVSPTRAVTIGQFHYSVFWHLGGPANSYTYDLEFASDGAIAATQHYRVSAAQLATVHARYYSEVTRSGADLRFSWLPWDRPVRVRPSPVVAASRNVRVDNGFCGNDYLCTGKPGYDAPTGLGTPNGTAAF